MRPRRNRRLFTLAFWVAPLFGIGLTASIAPTAAANVLRPIAEDPLIQPACGPVAPGHARCQALRYTPVSGGLGLRPTQPTGLSPTDIQSAYQLPSGGSGVTVAITDSYDDPNAEQDLSTYRQQFNLPACTSDNGCFKKVDQRGGTSYPRGDGSWAAETSLDLDAVSAACPACHILLLEADDNSDANLDTAIDKAVALGAKYVSNSWSENETSGETSFDSHYNVPGVLFAFATGDNGYSAGTQYPASSAYTLGVGGTSLTQGGGGRGWTETAWSGSGSGCSAYEQQPSWQANVNTTCSAHKAVADVAAVGDPNTGLAIYDTYQQSGWLQYGGTSLATPLVTAMAALAGPGGGTGDPAGYPYAHPGELTDVTSGNNGDCGTVLCDAGAGWDGPTGLGTPLGVGAFRPAASRHAT
jgi:subtilase family serine protease